MMIWNLFRTLTPQKLTLPLIENLSLQSNLSPSEIERWYQQFIYCYTYGYVSFNEFVVHIKQLCIYHGNRRSQLSKRFLWQLFSRLDIDRDQKLNFEEFFRFNILINQGNRNEKLIFILTFFKHDENIYFTQEKLIEFFINIFYLLNLSKFVEYLPEKIQKILSSINIDVEQKQISWNEFTLCILNHSNLFESLITIKSKENHIL